MHENVLSNLIITGFYTATTMYNAAGPKKHRTDRQRWGLLLKYEGETVYYNNGNSYISNSSNAVILPAGSVYDWECTESGHFCVVEFEANITHHHILSFPIRDSERLLNAFREAEYKLSMPTPLITAEMIRLCYGIMLTMVKLSQPRYLPDAKQSKLAPAIEYITKNYNTDISNELLASLAGMSVVYFRKLFREIKGEPPIAYARRLRIEKATEMLKSEYGTVSEVAVSLGYPSIYDFSRDFKKHIGLSPTQYARKFKETT